MLSRKGKEMTNTAIVSGRLTTDPTIKKNEGGEAMAAFTLANDSGKKKNGEKITMFVPIFAFGKVAEASALYLRKGKSCCVTGRLTIKSAKDNGVWTSSVSIVANTIDFLSNEKDSEPRGQESQNELEPPENAGGGEDVDDSKLPF